MNNFHMIVFVTNIQTREEASGVRLTTVVEPSWTRAAAVQAANHKVESGLSLKGERSRCEEAEHIQDEMFFRRFQYNTNFNLY